MVDGAIPSSSVCFLSSGGVDLASVNAEENECEDGSDLHVPSATERLAHLAEQNHPLNPSLNRLLAFLEDDDALTDMEANVSPSMLAAYHNKAREIAFILTEDSPGLNLNHSLQPRLSVPPLQQKVPSQTSYWSRQSPQTLAGPLQSQLLENLASAMPAFGPPRMLARPPYSVPGELLDEEPTKRNLAAKITEGIASNSLNSKGDREHKIANALKPRKEKYKAIGVSKEEDTYVDFSQLLLLCADAIGYNDTKTAMNSLLKVKKFASPHGEGTQRMAYYFANALESRLKGTGWQVYSGLMRQQRASPMEVFKASWMYMMRSPFAIALRYFVNQTILNVAKGASVVHIMEYQFTGFQYPSLFMALAKRPEGPPMVRLIAGNVPHYSLSSSEMEILFDRVEEIGQKLKYCARSFGVPFHFTPWVGKTGDFKMKDHVNPNRGPEEVLVILSVYPLRHINEDLLSPPEKRLRILQTVRSMNPEAFIRGFVTASYSTPYFKTRFRLVLSHFECQYDILDTFFEEKSPERLVFESEFLGRAILNLVACEETNLVEKVQEYNQCYAAMKRVGLEQMPLNKDLICEVQNMLRDFHKHYIVAGDRNYLLMGWKGRMLHAMAAWRGSKV